MLAGVVSGLGAESLPKLAGLLDPAGSTIPSSGQLQRGLSLSTAASSQLARGLDQVLRHTGVTIRDVQIVLETLALARGGGARQYETIEIACTAPNRLGVPLRTTYATAMEMISEAQNEILVVGYVFTGGAKSVFESLARASLERRVRVTVIGNRMEDHLRALHSAWLAGCPEPRVFSCPANLRDDMAALHAKVLVCDSLTALITSANYSFHGLHENIEVGVKIESPSVARIVEFFNAMIVSGDLGVVAWK